MRKKALCLALLIVLSIGTFGTFSLYADDGVPLNVALKSTSAKDKEMLVQSRHKLTLIQANVQRNQAINMQKTFAKYGLDLGHELELQLHLLEETAVPIANWQFELIVKESYLNRIITELTAEKLFVDSLNYKQQVELETERLNLETKRYKQQELLHNLGEITDLDLKKQSLVLRRQAHALTAARLQFEKAFGQLCAITGESVLIETPHKNTNSVPTITFINSQLPHRYELQTLHIQNKINQTTMTVYEAKQFLAYPQNERQYKKLQAEVALNENTLAERRKSIQLEIEQALIDIETANRLIEQLANQLIQERESLTLSKISLLHGKITQIEFEELKLHEMSLNHRYNLAIAHYNLLRKQLYFATTIGPSYKGGI